MWLRLSLRMGVPVRLLQRQMSSQEFSEMILFERMEPQDPERSDWRIALSTAQILNAISKITGGKGEIKVEDLLLKFQQPQSPQAPTDDLKTKLKTWLLKGRKK